MKSRIIIATGLLLALSFPPFPFYYFAFIAFIPFLIGIEHYLKEKSENKSTGIFTKFYLSFFIYHLLTNWWISSFQKETDPFLMASGFSMDLLHPLFFLIPCYVYLKIRKKFGLNIGLITFPIIWAGWEYFHSSGEFSYPWLAIGNTQIYNNYWIQGIDIYGVFGASFLIAIINVLFAKFLLNIYQKKYLEKPRINLKYILIVLILFIIPILYGIKQYEKYNHIELKKQNSSIRIGIIQPNVNPWRKWQGGAIDQISMMIAVQDSLINYDKKIDLGLFPETSIMRVSPTMNTDLNMWFLGDWVNRNNPIISGFVNDYKYQKNEKRQITARYIEYDSSWYESFNSAIMINKNATPQVYHKMKLTPFAERIPRVENLSFLMNWINWGVGISSWGLGQNQKVLELYKNNDTIKIGNIICIESIYPDFIRNFANQGAEIFTLITNDSWYDGTYGPEQHYLIACMRAIENKRYIARCANSGVSGFISPLGESISRLEQYQKLGKAEDLPLLKEKTIYSENGDIFPKFLMFLGLFIWIISFFKKKR